MIRGRFLRKLNKEHANRGVALISVIIVISVVSTLGLLALSVSYDAFNMKQIEKNASQNNYGAEKALEAIAVGLQGTLSECYLEAYTEVMENYASYDSAFEMQMNYEDKVLVALSQALEDGDNPGYYRTDILLTYAEKILSVESDSETEEEAIIPTVTINEADNYMSLTADKLLLKNVTVTYTEGIYSDTIVTDIQIDVPVIEFERIANMPSLVDYALIANEGITVEGSGGTKNVSGKLYAGIIDTTKQAFLQLKENTSLNLGVGANLTLDNVESKEVVFKGNVELNGNASFETNGNTTLWATGLTTNASKEVLSDIEKTNSLSLLGVSYVKDDITINGAKNQLTLGGRYFGYSNNSSEASESSAIIVNGVDTSIDISKVNTMVLSGTSFVGAKGEAYDSAQFGNEQHLNEDVFMGDSIAVKGNQLVYMVPKECEGVANNPMTYEQYKTLTANDNWESKILSSQISGLGRSIRSYGDVKVTPIFTNKMGGAVYLYLEFSSIEASSKFFMDNYGVSANGQKAKEILNTYVEAFTFMEDGQIYSSGNYLISDANNKAVYTAATDGIQDMNLSEMHANKCRELDFDQLINKNILKQLTGTNGIYSGNITVVSDDIMRIETKSQLVVVDNEDSEPYVIDQASAIGNEVFNGTGVVIATGDVIVSLDHGNNNPIKGMIICGGTLRILGTNQRFIADSEAVEQALRIEDENGISGMDLFKGYGGNAENVSSNETDNEKSDIRNCVSFVNTKKQ